METLIHHKGSIDHSRIGKFIREIEKLQENYKFPGDKVKRLINIMIEMVENAQKYAQSLELDKNSKFREIDLQIDADMNGNFRIYVGNYVHKSDINALRERLELLNSLNRDEIKKRYKKRLKEGIYENSNSAGLGLMRMIKLSRNKIDYRLEDIDNKFLYFNIQINIEKTQA